MHYKCRLKRPFGHCAPSPCNLNSGWFGRVYYFISRHHIFHSPPKKQQKKNPRWVNDFSYFNEKFCLLATERGWSMKVPCLNMTARLIGLYWVWLTFRLTEMGLLERLMKTWRSCTVEWGSSISFEAAKTAKKTYKKLCRRWQDGTISRKHQSCRSDHKKIYTMHPFL